MHPANLEADADRIVTIVYTNHEGYVKRYRIIPHSVKFGRTQYYPVEQWLIEATDVDRNVHRTFAMQHIHKWLIA
jgi:hypothetical protein